MELVFRVSLCLLTFIGKTFGDEIGIVKISRKEDEDVMLSCSFKENLKNKRFDWKKDGKDVLLCEYGEVSPSKQDDQFRERVSLFPDQLNYGNASIIIKKSKVSDSGNYTCLHIDSKESYKIELTVVCILKDRTNDPEKKPGTCPKPSFSILNEVNGGTLVECEAHGAYPKPTMEVQNSGNITVNGEAPKITPNGNYFDVILQVVVTKKDHYHCVVKQEDLCHQIYSKRTFVHVPSENTTKENPTGEMDVKRLVGFICLAVFGISGIIAAGFFYIKYRHIKKSSDDTENTNSVKPSSTGNTENKTEGIQGPEDVPLANNA